MRCAMMGDMMMAMIDTFREQASGVDPNDLSEQFSAAHTQLALKHKICMLCAAEGPQTSCLRKTRQSAKQ